MKDILLGHDVDTGQPVRIPLEAFDRHVHLPGSTGSGKTTALLTMLYPLLTDAYHPACHVIVDFLGGLTFQLLLWMSSRYCPAWVRERLVLIQPSKGDLVMPMNPLLYEDEDHGFFKVNRAMDLLLRCWHAQSLGEQPRLARWLFNALWAVAQLGLTIADSMHLLLPRSQFHAALLQALPGRLQLEWRELLDERSAKKMEILDSTRNRMKPFFESAILRSMFGSTYNRLDLLRFMREQKIVVLNLAPAGRLAPQEQNAIAGLVNNELLAVTRSLPRTVRYPVYVWLEECQRVVSPDLEFAIPEVRQLGIKLILAHQSFAQLKRPPDLDLTSLIFLPNTRLIFAEHGEDAEILSNEVASLQFDPMRIKDEIYSLQQLQTGHELVELSGSSTAHMDARKWEETYGQQWTRNRGSSRPEDSTVKTLSDAEARGDHRAHGRGSSTSTTHTENTHQQLIAKLDTIRQLCSRTYVSFDEQRQEWAKLIRTLRTGECLSKAWNDPHIHHVRVQETRPGILAFEPAVVQERLPQAWEAYERLLDWNFARDFFVSPAAIERETEERLQRVLRPAITLSSNAAQSPTSEEFSA